MATNTLTAKSLVPSILPALQPQQLCPSARAPLFRLLYVQPMLQFHLHEFSCRPEIIRSFCQSAQLLSSLTENRNRKRLVSIVTYRSFIQPSLLKRMEHTALVYTSPPSSFCLFPQITFKENESISLYTLCISGLGP